MRLRREDHTGRDIVFTSETEITNGITIAQDLRPEEFIGAIVIATVGTSVFYAVITNVVISSETPDIITLLSTDGSSVNEYTYTRSTGLIVGTSSPIGGGTGPM